MENVFQVASCNNNKPIIKLTTWFMFPDKIHKKKLTKTSLK